MRWLGVKIQKMLAVVLAAVFFGINIGAHQAIAQSIVLPPAGTMVTLSPAFNPSVIKGIRFYQDNPFNFDFIIDTGDERLNPEKTKEQGRKLIEFFLASLTTPEKEIWVNLSPFERQRIIPEVFGQTQMGQTLLGQDYLLKQIMATALYPERELGKEFWQKVYAQAAKQFGTTNVPVNTFNKVWIVPDQAEVFQNEQMNAVFVVKATLKVLLEQDYLAKQKHKEAGGPEEGSRWSAGNEHQRDTAGTGPALMASKIIRQIVIPALEKEVNEGKNFAPLRQVYHSLILAKWYKENLKNNIIAKAYVDRNKIDGVDSEDKQMSQKIYEQYLKAYRKGVYNFIKEEIDPATQTMIPRKYFSGGFTTRDMAMVRVQEPDRAMLGPALKKMMIVSVVALAASLSMAGTASAGEVSIQSGGNAWKAVGQLLNTQSSKAINDAFEENRVEIIRNGIRLPTASFGKVAVGDIVKLKSSNAAGVMTAETTSSLPTQNNALDGGAKLGGMPMPVPPPMATPPVNPKTPLNTANLSPISNPDGVTATIAEAMDFEEMAKNTINARYSGLQRIRGYEHEEWGKDVIDPLDFKTLVAASVRGVGSAAGSPVPPDLDIPIPPEPPAYKIYPVPIGPTLANARYYIVRDAVGAGHGLPGLGSPENLPRNVSIESQLGIQPNLVIPKGDFWATFYGLAGVGSKVTSLDENGRKVNVPFNPYSPGIAVPKNLIHMLNKYVVISGKDAFGNRTELLAFVYDVCEGCQGNQVDFFEGLKMKFNNMVNRNGLNGDVINALLEEGMLEEAGNGKLRITDQVISTDYRTKLVELFVRKGWSMNEARNTYFKIRGSSGGVSGFKILPYNPSKEYNLTFLGKPPLNPVPSFATEIWGKGRFDIFNAVKTVEGGITIGGVRYSAIDLKRFADRKMVDTLPGIEVAEARSVGLVISPTVVRPPDMAQLIKVSPTGGIDLNDTAVTATGGKVKTAFEDPAQLDMLMKASGLRPIIYNIKPMTLPLMSSLLGVSG